jgi:hypothetical protein
VAVNINALSDTIQSVLRDMTSLQSSIANTADLGGTLLGLQGVIEGLAGIPTSTQPMHPDSLLRVAVPTSTTTAPPNVLLPRSRIRIFHRTVPFPSTTAATRDGPPNAHAASDWVEEEMDNTDEDGYGGMMRMDLMGYDDEAARDRILDAEADRAEDQRLARLKPTRRRCTWLISLLKDEAFGNKNDRRYGTVCGICLDEFNPRSRVSVLPHCGHYIHRTCIKKTIRAGFVDCPTCKTHMFTHDQLQESSVLRNP